MCQLVEYTYVEIVSNNQHGCIATCTLTLHLDNREFAIFRRLPRFDATEVLTNGIEDFC